MASEENFDDLTQPIYENGRFKNPWKTFKDSGGGIGGIFKYIFCTKDRSNYPTKKEELDARLPVVPSAEVQQRTLQGAAKGQWQMTWLGHASVLYQADGLNVLADPIFSNYCSPVPPIGPKRRRPPALSVAELPHIDAVIISHNHYDHLDKPTIKQLIARFGETITWYVPQGIGEFMTSVGCKPERVRELTWWQEVTHDGTRTDTGGMPVRFVLTPAQHFCNRGLHDQNKALWGTWSVLGEHRFFFGGDTAYCEAFSVVGRKYGPFDCAAIPIGAYEPGWMMSNIHVSPQEAVQIHEDVRSRFSLGIHWGTFKLTLEPFDEPPKLLSQYMQQRDKQSQAGPFITVPHGGTCTAETEQFPGHL